LGDEQVDQPDESRLHAKVQGGSVQMKEKDGLSELLGSDG